MLWLPTLGPLHLLHPRYNAQTVLEQVKAVQPEGIFLASYGLPELQAGTWRDGGELSLFHVLPWAEANQIPVVALDEDFRLKAEAEQFRALLGQIPKGKQLLEQLGEYEAKLQALLTQPLTPAELSNPEFVLGLHNYLDGVVELFGEGPATGFRQQRMKGVAGKLKEEKGLVGTTGWSSSGNVVLVDVLDYPILKNLLPVPRPLFPIPSSEPERHRAILDRAWRLEPGDDWAALLNQLQEIDGPEAMYLAAQIYLAAGQTEDAFSLLEQLIHTDFQQPEYLPGYVLARYGQLADALGQRDKALRAYRAVLALSWTPAEAIEVAQAGQRGPLNVGQSLNAKG
jgi:tetratricopeptide (TPR) repeat protein